MRDIDEGIASHPVVVHYWEEHEGRKQDFIMRIISGHLTPLERQATESINIVEAENRPQEALNRKTEGGGAKIPGILVTHPKGIAKQQKDRTEMKEDAEEPRNIIVEPQTYNSRNRRGIKRLKYIGDDTGANETFLETIEEEELSLERPEQEPGTRKRCRRTSPAPSKAYKSPKKPKVSKVSKIQV